MSDPGYPHKKRGVRWNESNLAENELVRAEIRQGCPRIDEPKTPYHHDEDVEDVEDIEDVETNGTERLEDTRDQACHDEDDEGLWSERSSRGRSSGPSDVSVPCLKKRERGAEFIARGTQHVESPSKGSNDKDTVMITNETHADDHDDHVDDPQQIPPPSDPRRLRTAFDVAIEAEQKEEREQEIAKAEKKRAFEEARRRHYGNAGLGMRLGNLLAKNQDESSDEDRDGDGDRDGDDIDARDEALGDTMT